MNFKEKFVDNSSHNEDGSKKFETYGFRDPVSAVESYSANFAISSVLTKTENGWRGSFSLSLNNLNLDNMTAEEAKAELEALVNQTLKTLSKGELCQKCGR